MSPKEGLIRGYLEKKIPSNWYKLGRAEHMAFLSDERGQDTPDLVERTKVCPLEVWVEALNGDPKNIKSYDVKEITAAIKKTAGWKRSKSTLRFGEYGVQKGYTFTILKSG